RDAEIDMRDADIVLCEGLYAIADRTDLGNFREFMDFAIYLDADPKHAESWDYQRERQKSNARSEQNMVHHWKEGEYPDWKENIYPSKKNADYVVWFDQDHHMTVTRQQQKPAESASATAGPGRTASIFTAMIDGISPVVAQFGRGHFEQRL